MLALALQGCTERGGEEAPGAPLPGFPPQGFEPGDHLPPAEAFRWMEDGLMAAERRWVDFHVTAEGAFSASLEGRLVLWEGNELALRGAGRFGEDSVSLWLDGGRGRLAWGRGGESGQDALPDGLREAVVVGLTRMGVLHNLARLATGAPPDRMEGGARSWVEVEDLEWVEGGGQGGEWELGFSILVDGQRTGRARIRLDREGRMVGREQVVEFPGGEMMVRESYRWDGWGTGPVAQR